jgi:YggT family protein
MNIAYIVRHVIDLYSLLMLIWVIASWVPQMQRNVLVQYVGRVCEPPLRVVRRILPATGGIDFSPMVVLLGLQLLSRNLSSII